MEEQEREPRFHHGDKVRVREWDDMAAEYGMDGDGDIKMPFGFTEPMKQFCGQEYTVEEASVFCGYVAYTFEEISNIALYGISEEMLEPADDPVDEDLFECPELGDYLNKWARA